MDIDYPDDAEFFRDRIRGFLQTHLPPTWAGVGSLPPGDQEPFLRDWRRLLAANGLIAVSWPSEYGGAGLSTIEQVVLVEEFAKVGAPTGTKNDNFTLNLLGNTIIEMGSDEQKRHLLPRMLSGEDRWCQGYSEPDAGSDLGAMRTRAHLEGESWLINGQKTWTSKADTANWIFVIARTDPEVPKHQGLTCLMVQMDQPGVEIRPIINAVGHGTFFEVFFTDARARAEDVLGGVGNGWKTALTVLGYERGAQVTHEAHEFRRDLDRLLLLAAEQGLSSDSRIRDRLAWCYSMVEVMRYRGYRGLTSIMRGSALGPETSITKVFGTEYFQRYTELAVELLGLAAVTPTGDGNHGAHIVPEPGLADSPSVWVDQLLYARAATIYGGSAEIQRNIIGERLLGLPREPKLDGGPFSQLAATRGVTQ